MRIPRRLAVGLFVLALVAGACSPGPTAAPGSPSVGVPSPGAGASAPGASGGAGASAGAACVPAVPAASRDWNDRVWYEVFVRSFADGNGDGIGDLRGLTAKLDYLNDGDPATTTDLGITGIWLMPIMEAASYHGYDVIDYRKVEQDYGTSAHFKAFLAAAHERGIKVILDLVMNHTSDRNPWFEDSVTPGSAHDDWYVWSPTDPGYPGPTGQTVWHALGERWYYGVFSGAMPDLNLRNPAVTAELESVAAYWLDQGVDGFRLDAIPYLVENGRKQLSTPETLGWLTGLKAAVRAVNPDAMLIGEVWAGSSVAGRYVPGSVDLTFDFDLAAATVAAVQNGQPAPLASALQETVRFWPANQEGTFLTNHDQPRVMSQLNGSVDEARLAALLLMTEPGVPFVYYGEELGLTGTKPDERIRTPMPWTGALPGGGFTTATPWEPLASSAPTTNVAAEAADPDSLLATYRELIRLHGSDTTLRAGATVPVAATGPVVAWLRVTANRTLLVVANASAAAVGDYALSLDAGPLCGAGPGAASIVASVNAGATGAGGTTGAAGPDIGRWLCGLSASGDAACPRRVRDRPRDPVNGDDPGRPAGVAAEERGRRARTAPRALAPRALGVPAGARDASP